MTNCYKCGLPISFSSEWVTKISKKNIPLDNINGKLTPHKCISESHKTCDCIVCMKNNYELSSYEKERLEKYRKKSGLDGLF